MELDATDSKILQLLQKDGRMSNADLAAQIHRSESACHRRVRQLEKAGVIEGYRAVINQAAIGKPANVFVEITLANMGEDTLNAFEEAVGACDDVITCFFMTGDADYLLHIAAAFALGALLRTLAPGILRPKLETSGDFFRSLGLGFVAVIVTPFALVLLAVIFAVSLLRLGARRFFVENLFPESDHDHAHDHDGDVPGEAEATPPR